MSKFGIYAWPAYATKKVNPYNYLIYKHIEEEGYPIHDFSIDKEFNLLKIAFSSKYKILHMHWPSTNVLKVNSLLGAWKRLITFYLVIKIIKLFGKKIFWTVHNLEDHENLYPFLQNCMDKLLYNNVDGFISMNRTGLEMIRKRLKYNNRQRVSYIPHPHYKGYYLNDLTRDEVRKKLNIPRESFVFLFVGQIRTYKNLPSLIKAFRSLNDQNTILLIAGRVCKDVSLPLLNELIGDADNIKFFNSFVEDDNIQVYLNAADLVVLPYSKVFNSGSVFLNLSFNKPTLAPDMYALSEFNESLGPVWIKTYKGTLTSDILKKSMKETIQEGDNTPKPNIEVYDPELIARNTISFYRSFI